MCPSQTEAHRHCLQRHMCFYALLTSECDVVDCITRLKVSMRRIHRSRSSSQSIITATYLANTEHDSEQILTRTSSSTFSCRRVFLFSVALSSCVELCLLPLSSPPLV